ncbi:hypothetical protein B0H17DRAFT_1210594 [Mycena rosella]|uniref:F-box domain-containing protein n=1 Tax=Mycena rosella TaxID=1033263 RepID=A0AAD7CWJ5_MYCRO|nr:hypothetical protein B0H17DRAFT_1210594 [Mycena rosella]
MHLDHLRNELADIEISIIRQRLLLEELEERKAAVRAELDGFVFPVLTLPPEITAEIFLQLALGDSNDDDSRDFQGVLLILAVCRTWRTLALSVPALWATLNLRTLAWRPNAPGEMEELVDTWFSRAGALPLSLNWFGNLEQSSGQLNTIIGRHALRLQSLHIGIDMGCVSDLIDSIPFPRLELLALENYDDIAPDMPVSTFGEAPQLRHVSLQRVSPSSLILPWGLLEIFSATFITPHQCLYVLRAAPLLRKFDFYGSPEGSFDDDEAVILHLRLTSFRLCNGGQEIVQYLALPALEVLSFENLPGLDDDIFLPFLSRLRGSLRDFTISCRGRLVLISPQWFQHMPHLTDLNLARLQPQSRAGFVRALNRHHKREFLPALKNLTFMDWQPFEVDIELLDALATRCTQMEADEGHMRMPLKSLRLIWEVDYPVTSVPSLIDIENLVQRHGVALRDLRRRGMGIHIGTKDCNYLFLSGDRWKLEISLKAVFPWHA